MAPGDSCFCDKSSYYMYICSLIKGSIDIVYLYIFIFIFLTRFVALHDNQTMPYLSFVIQMEMMIVVKI